MVKKMSENYVITVPRSWLGRFLLGWKLVFHGVKAERRGSVLLLDKEFTK